MSAEYCPLCWAEGLSAALPGLQRLEQAALIQDAMRRLHPVIGTTPGYQAVAGWLAPVGAVGVSGPLVGYYNQIQTGVTDACLLWPEAAATFKMAEVAPNMLKADIGAVNTKVLTVNGDTWAKLPAEVQKVLQDVAIEYRDLLAKLAAEEGAASVAAYKKAGGTVHDLAKAERSQWARDMPNLAQQWAAGLDKEGAQGTEMLKYYMDAMRAARQPIERQWDRE